MKVKGDKGTIEKCLKASRESYNIAVKGEGEGSANAGRIKEDIDTMEDELVKADESYKIYITKIIEILQEYKFL